MNLSLFFLYPSLSLQIRVGGTLTTLYGFYYLGAAFGEINHSGMQGFYRSTIVGRVFLAVCFSIFVGLGECPPALLLLAALNVVGAWIMHKSLSI